MTSKPVRRHWTRGRLVTVGILILCAITIAIWGWAGADSYAPLSIAGFPGGTSRVLTGVSYDFTVTARPSSVGTYEHYLVQVYAGARTDFVAANSAFNFTTNGRTLCSQWESLSNKDSFLVHREILDGNQSYTIPISYTFNTGGQNYVFVFIVGYNNDSSFDPNNPTAITCALDGLSAAGSATSFNVETNSWGCNKGICIINVDPQTLPSNSYNTSYMVYLSGMQADKSYAYISGRYEKDLGTTSKADMCKAVLKAPTGSGANHAHDLITVRPSEEGSAYLSSRYSITFNNTAANKRLVAFLLRLDGANRTFPTSETACDYVVDMAGWSYNSTGVGTGNSDPDDDPTAATSVSSSGGFIATGLSDVDPIGTSGSFLSGVCSSGSNIKLNLSGESGTIDLKQAGLMGICTPNVAGQVLKLMMLLAAFFFTVTVITSGIAMMRAADSAGLESAKKNLISSAIGAFLIVFANWIVPAAINIIAKLFQ